MLAAAIASSLLIRPVAGSGRGGSLPPAGVGELSEARAEKVTAAARPPATLADWQKANCGRNFWPSSALILCPRRCRRAPWASR